MFTGAVVRPDRRGPVLRVGLLVTAIAATAVAVSAAPAAAIAGGSDVQPGKMSYVAEVRNTAIGALCTGTLIRPDWVLTAAHCSVPATVGDVSVRVGNTTSQSGGQLRRVSRIVRHPSYTGGHNDLALLQLNSPITGITPAPLAPPSSAYLWDGAPAPFFHSDAGVAVGWGRDTAGNLPGTLQSVTTFITPTTDDALGLKMINVATGPCPGDSGGPLLVGVGGTLAVAGVVKAAACGGAGDYSEVGAGANRDWLESQLPPMPATPYGIADWDRDGFQDIITRFNATGDLWLYPGEGTRAYSNATPVKIGNGWNGATFFGVIDWNKDGHQDILSRKDTTGELWLYPGQSKRAYSTTPPLKIASGWNSLSPVGVGDWDRDGLPDVVARDDVSGALYLYPATSGSLSLGGRVLIGTGWNAYTGFGVTDWDANGRLDIVSRSNDDGDLWLYPGQGTRIDSTGPRVKIGNGWNGATTFGLADWDRDGAKDIITRLDSSGDLRLFPGQSVRGYSQIQPVRIGNGW